MVQPKQSVFTRILVGNQVKEKLAFLDAFPDEAHGIELEIMDYKEELKATEDAITVITARKMNEAYGLCAKLKNEGKSANNKEYREAKTLELLQKDADYNKLVIQKQEQEQEIERAQKRLKMKERRFSATKYALATINTLLDHYSKVELHHKR